MATQENTGRHRQRFTVRRWTLQADGTNVQIVIGRPVNSRNQLKKALHRARVRRPDAEGWITTIYR